jgi:hypothetical protein
MEPHGFGCERAHGAKRARHGEARAPRQCFDDSVALALSARIARRHQRLDRDTSISVGVDPIERSHDTPIAFPRVARQRVPSRRTSARSQRRFAGPRHRPSTERHGGRDPRSALPRRRSWRSTHRVPNDLAVGVAEPSERERVRSAGSQRTTRGINAVGSLHTRGSSSVFTTRGRASPDCRGELRDARDGSAGPGLVGRPGFEDFGVVWQ